MTAKPGTGESGCGCSDDANSECLCAADASGRDRAADGDELCCGGNTDAADQDAAPS